MCALLNFDLSTRVCGYLTVPPPDYTSFAPTDINVSLFYKLDNVTGHVLAHSEPHPLGVDCLAASLRVDDTNTATESPTFGFYLIIENLFIGKVHIYSDSDINIHSLLVKSPFSPEGEEGRTSDVWCDGGRPGTGAPWHIVSAQTFSSTSFR